MKKLFLKDNTVPQREIVRLFVHATPRSRAGYLLHWFSYSVDIVRMNASVSAPGKILLHFACLPEKAGRATRYEEVAAEKARRAARLLQAS